MASSADRLTALVTRQIGRPPRSPWTVAATCAFGFPTVIASPPRLDDGTPFPTTYWLTCPHLTEAASAAESDGLLAEWDARIVADPDLANALAEADTELRARRAAAAGGDDPCEGVGVAGQASLAAKCLHARVALTLVGIEDPIGAALLGSAGATCEDERCRLLETPDRPAEGTP